MTLSSALKVLRMTDNLAIACSLKVDTSILQ